jgi:uncharacterized RDD family membrane protein YckC
MTDYPPPPPQNPQDPWTPQGGQPQTPGQPAYPSAPPPPPAGQGGWGDAPAYGAPTGYGPPVPYAEWIKRVGAYLVDMVVVLPGYLVALVGLAIGSADSNVASGLGLLLVAVGYLGVFGILIWNLIFRQGRTGWSVGKQVLGIRLIGEATGAPIGPGLTFVRALCHILDSLPCYLGYLWPLWDQKKQTFADKIMGTVVIEQKKV